MSKTPYLDRSDPPLLISRSDIVHLIDPSGGGIHDTAPSFARGPARRALKGAVSRLEDRRAELITWLIWRPLLGSLLRRARSANARLRATAVPRVPDWG